MEYSSEVAKAITDSKIIAIEIGSKTIRPEHLFLALIESEESEAYQVLRDMNLNIDAIKQTLKSWSSQYQYQIGVNKLRSNSVINLDAQTEDIIKNKSKIFAEEMNANEISSEHVFYCILQDDNNVVTELLRKTPEIYKNLKLRLRHEEDENENENN